MCGIAGYITFGKQRPELHELRELLLAIEPRGGDATGMAMFSGQKLRIAKGPVTAPEFVEDKTFTALEKGIPEKIIFHTRKMTKGTPENNQNNHPIHIKKDGIALVHNGCISNDDEVFKALKLPRQAQVDSEILAQLMRKAKTYEKGLASISKYCNGSAAFAMLHEANPNHLLLARATNPVELLLDKERDILFFASTTTAVKKGKATLGTKTGWRGFEIENSLYGAQPTMKANTAYIIGRNGIEKTIDFPLEFFTAYTQNWQNEGVFGERKKKAEWHRFQNGHKYAPCPSCYVLSLIKKIPKIKPHEFLCVNCYSKGLYEHDNKTASNQERCTKCNRYFAEPLLQQWPIGDTTAITSLDLLCHSCYADVNKMYGSCAACGEWRHRLGTNYSHAHGGYLCPECEGKDEDKLLT